VSAVRKVRLGPVDTLVTARPDGSLLMRSSHALPAYPRCLTERLAHWAREAPERVFLAQRNAAGAWRTVTYAEAFDLARRIGQALLDRSLSAERPIIVLSGNDIEHALLGLAALHVGIPYAPISPAYSLLSQDHAKLRSLVALLTPGMVFAASGAAYAKAIAAAVPREAELVVTGAPPEDRTATLFSSLAATAPSAAVEAAHEAVGPDTVAKFLFTSGSTGMPKAVINTERMLCSNQEMILRSFPFMGEVPPVIVDWLPWNHTFGGNHNVGLILYNGGSLYIDGGKPVPGAIEETVRNLREIAPTVFFNVPKGYEMLAPYFRREPALRDKFFSRLSMMFYAGAGLSQHVWDEFEALAIQSCGTRILMITGLGATETAPFGTCAHWDGGRSGGVGVPVPGQEVKIAPAGEKLEIRMRGPNVTPGYWRNPEATRAAFDEEGYYRLGDAVRFVDTKDPKRGLVFDGRLSEDFKLSTGTWVSVGPLRARIILHFAPFLRDVVIAGLDRDDVGALLFADIEACRALCPELGKEAGDAAVLRHAAVRARFQQLLDDFARESTGSSNRVVRVMFCEEPPSIDANEVTDKGSLNAGAVLTRRAALVDALYAADPSPNVIILNSRRRTDVA
jgi:feruloyl-CoA synthase